MKPWKRNFTGRKNKMKAIQILGLTLLLVFLAGWTAFSGQDTQFPERLDTGAFDSPTRPGAVFGHDGHIMMLDDDCTICHHVYEDGKLVADESSENDSCSDCHGLKAGTDNGMPLEAAYHKLCKDCHFSRDKGPVLCGECHQETGN